MELMEQSTTLPGDPGLTAWFTAAAFAAVGTVLVVLLWLKLRHRRDLGARVLAWLLGRRPAAIEESPPMAATPAAPPAPQAEVPHAQQIQDLKRALAAYRETKGADASVPAEGDTLSEARLNEYLNRLRAAADRLELLAETPRHSPS